MIELTPDFVGGSFIVMLIFYLIAFAFQLYMMYLNWKQSKVQNQMEDLIREVRAIKRILRRKKL